MNILRVHTATASPEERSTGLMAYIRVETVEGFVLDGLTLRRTADSRLAISFPARTDRRGEKHPFIRPIDEKTRSRFEREVFAQLGLGDLT